MFFIPEEYLAAFKTNFDAQLAMSTVLTMKAFEGAGKLAALNMDLAKSSLERSAIATKQLMAATGPQEFLSLVAKRVQPDVSKALSYGRGVVSIASRSHGEFTKAAEAQINDINRKVAIAVDEVVKNAPAGSEPAIALMKSAIGHANARYEKLSKAAHQTVDVLEANLSMAASQFAQAVEERRSSAHN